MCVSQSSVNKKGKALIKAVITLSKQLYTLPLCHTKQSTINIQLKLSHRGTIRFYLAVGPPAFFLFLLITGRVSPLKTI